MHGHHLRNPDGYSVKECFLVPVIQILSLIAVKQRTKRSNLVSLLKLMQVRVWSKAVILRFVAFGTGTDKVP